MAGAYSELLGQCQAPMPLVADVDHREPLKIKIADMSLPGFRRGPRLQQAAVAAAETLALAEENRVLRNQIEKACLAQENAFLRWQLQQQHLQGMSMTITQASGMPPFAPLCIGQLSTQEHGSRPWSPRAPPGLSRSGLDTDLESRNTVNTDSHNDSIDNSATETQNGVCRTTCMLRNLPNTYTREDLVKSVLDKCGFAGRYSFVYIPMDFKSGTNLGYAFVDMASHEDAELFHGKLQGFSDWGLEAFGSEKVCEVSWSQLQGLEAHIERYRNSPVMHESVSDSFKPLIFVDGKSVPLPAPTKKIRVPRQWVRKH